MLPLASHHCYLPTGQRLVRSSCIKTAGSRWETLSRLQYLGRPPNALEHPSCNNMVRTMKTAATTSLVQARLGTGTARYRTVGGRQR